MTQKESYRFYWANTYSFSSFWIEMSLPRQPKCDMSEAESEAPSNSVEGQKEEEANWRISNSTKEKVKNGMPCQLRLKSK
jgi:hypothetical protein